MQMTDSNSICDGRQHYNLSGLSGDSRYFVEVIKLFESYLGAGYLTGDRVLSLLNHRSQSALYAAITNDSPGHCVGAMLVYVMPQKECLNYTRLLQDKINVDLSQYQKLGLLKSLVVSETYRSQGIGNALIEQSLQQFRQWSCSAALTIAWIPSDGAYSSLSLFKGAGFEVLASFDNFWQQSSIVEKFICPACGSIPCHCSAAFMMRKVASQA